MKILVTGADGFIGSHLVPLLQSKGHHMYSLKSKLEQHKYVKKEVLDFSPDIIVHLAARTEVEQSFYEQIDFTQVNYVGTVNLIEVAREVPNLKNFVFASTMEVYGWQPVSDLIRDGKETEEDIIAFDEDTQPNPNAPYAVAKYACEKYLEYAHRSYGLPFTAIRQTNAYGRKDNDFFVTEQIITQMLKNPSEINLGYGEPYRNFIWIEDLLKAWIGVIENPNKVAGEIYCLGPDNAIKIKDYVQLIADKMGWTGTVNWNTKKERPGEIYLLNSTGKKLEDAIGWKPKKTLENGVVNTINIWKKLIK